MKHCVHQARRKLGRRYVFFFSSFLVNYTDCSASGVKDNCHLCAVTIRKLKKIICNIRSLLTFNIIIKGNRQWQ